MYIDTYFIICTYIYIQFHNRWIDESWDWLKSIGLREEFMSKCVHADNKLAHYARACTDILFKFPFGTQVAYLYTYMCI
jgi:glycyl-tRNA synthetase